MKTFFSAAALMFASLLLPASAVFADNEDTPLPGDTQTAPVVQHHLATHGRKLSTPKKEAGAQPSASRHKAAKARGKAAHAAKKHKAKKAVHGTKARSHIKAKPQHAKPAHARHVSKTAKKPVGKSAKKPAAHARRHKKH